MRAGAVAVNALDLTRPGVWTQLFPRALRLMTHLESQTSHPIWSFGGGTVLMLRLGHRLSKDIDLFVPDPQYLGYVNPRLSDVAEEVSTDYEESAEFLKFFLSDGEIDIVVGTSLTVQPFEVAQYAGRDIRFETNAEIIAKKCGIAATKPKPATCLIYAPLPLLTRQRLPRHSPSLLGTAARF